ncbi:multicopper oxidase [Eremomyces bilateralis CBS 781.70]|uniref:Multicopper oxidase n=1 Tax=Eremomyces bilateralis CBS 781.70 TaxID=1392243 RepID=A0A6G1G349_9PEZI|nr:multicopper oxidase [Eremomyces bilateralis CBS 781.70]KAF1812537.1 multicopper oxidase [Eremomyces bilateralis CBS 781.70]
MAPSVWKTIKTGGRLIATVSSAQQNGKSFWGNLDAPRFPSALTNNPIPDGSPWGPRTCENSNPAHLPDVPNTGITRKYDFTVARAVIAPDGVERDAILVNEQFPGPQIEANWGDWIEVTVHNQIESPKEGTSIHWHGFLQTETPWFDGVSGTSQCPIAPGASLTYRFQAEEYGTTWWHAHFSAQYNAGVVGPIIIYGPTQHKYDEDVGPIMLSDWYHAPYFKIVSDMVGTDLSRIPPKSDNNLINGRNNFDCNNIPLNSTQKCTPNAGLSKFHFDKGQSYRLRLLNVGSDGVQRFSIDQHTMTVIAEDFVPIKPYDTDVVTLGVGQRTDVIVKATEGNRDLYWVRATLVGGKPCGESRNPEALAVVYYNRADTEQVPASTASRIDTTTCNNDPLMSSVPMFPIVPGEPSFTQELVLSLAVNQMGQFEWRINNQTFRTNFNKPILDLASQGITSYPDDPQLNVYNYGTNTSVRFIIENNAPAVHPWHLHGYDFFVLDSGKGKWNGSIVNAHNPQRRDVHIIEANGYAVYQVTTDNPGVWPFHCHIAWHLSGGLSMNVMVKPGDLKPIPEMISQTCAKWQAYIDTNPGGPIDTA